MLKSDPLEPLLGSTRHGSTKPHSLCFIVTLIAFGQLNRIFNASVGAIDKLLASHHLLLSATTMILTYFIFMSFSCCSCGKMPPNRPPFYFFCICGFLNTASFATNLLAYKFTTNTNAALMQLFGIIVAALFSQILFGVKYLALHYLGMLLAIVGLVVAVLPEL